MKNADIKEIRYNNNEVVALYKGTTLIYQKEENLINEADNEGNQK